MTTTIDDDAKVYVLADVTLDVDPTGSTVKLKVGATLYDMAWQGAAELVAGEFGDEWRRTASTTAKFCGSTVTASGSDVKLTPGRYDSQPIISTTDGQIVPASTRSLLVR